MSIIRRIYYSSGRVKYRRQISMTKKYRLAAKLAAINIIPMPFNNSVMDQHDMLPCSVKDYLDHEFN